MASSIQSLRSNATAAHTVPMFAFLAFMALPGIFRVAENPDLPWWQYRPEIWIYPVQCLVIGAMILFWWSNYRFKPLGLTSILLGVIAGAVGIGIWLAPNYLFRHFGWAPTITWNGEPVTLFGFMARPKGFDPDVFATGSSAWWLTVVLRFFRGVVIVPFVEEPFWRGFVWRYLSDPLQRWERPPFGVKNWRVILITCFAMMLAHMPADWATCFIWSFIVSLVAIRTKSLGACVICHAVSNLLMNLYIMATKEWGFW